MLNQHLLGRLQACSSTPQSCGSIAQLVCSASLAICGAANSACCSSPPCHECCSRAPPDSPTAPSCQYPPTHICTCNVCPLHPRRGVHHVLAQLLHQLLQAEGAREPETLHTGVALDLQQTCPVIAAKSTGRPLNTADLGLIHLTAPVKYLSSPVGSLSRELCSVHCLSTLLISARPSFPITPTTRLLCRAEARDDLIQDGGLGVSRPPGGGGRWAPRIHLGLGGGALACAPQHPPTPKLSALSRLQCL